MNPPTMAGWNLGLRFVLELAALAGLAAAAWHLAPGAWRWVTVSVVPLAVAAAWATFNVVGDPSRSGAAPVEVPGAVRLALELLVLGGGAMALVVVGRRELATLSALAIVAHYVVAWRRVHWLLES